MMKSFEKWWDINGNQLESRFEPEDWFIAEAGWKAALEWVLGQCFTDWDEYDRSTGFFLLDDDIIKEELEND